MSSSRIKVRYTECPERPVFVGDVRWLDPKDGYIFHTMSSVTPIYRDAISCDGGWVVPTHPGLRFENVDCPWTPEQIEQMHPPRKLGLAKRIPPPPIPTKMPTADELFAAAEKPGASLEERKNGKVQMDLVVGGFPHLHWELGRMMTWAQKAKGYLPHDWKKYPADVFLAAAERHRNKRLRGETVDDESGLLHQVHEAFNLMAAAEVALMKKD